MMKMLNKILNIKQEWTINLKMNMKKKIIIKQMNRFKKKMKIMMKKKKKIIKTLMIKQNKNEDLKSIRFNIY